jgi:hypothetical protein
MSGIETSGEPATDIKTQNANPVAGADAIFEKPLF